MTDPRAAREAALAAAEARLRGDPSAVEREEKAQADKLAARRKKDEGWTPPGDKVDQETRRTFARLLDRGIIRDNGYRQASTCAETLLKIADNILNDPSNDPKFRTLKASNATLRNKILNCKGGHEYLIALGFRTHTIEFSSTYILEPRLKRMHESRIGRDVLEAHIPDSQKRVEQMKYSQTAHEKEEALRKARALAEIDADRDVVKTRVERERRSREYRATVDRDAQQRKKDEAVLVNYNHRDRGAPTIKEENEWGGSAGSEEKEEAEDDESDYEGSGGGRRLGGS